ncbi:MAG: hypothetical protein F6J87_18870 [Spirulina sp. SIO3F2]|nr:hypothetical protein [Spirulina sp. SIO3F2]
MKPLSVDASGPKKPPHQTCHKQSVWFAVGLMAIVAIVFSMVLAWGGRWL